MPKCRVSQPFRSIFAMRSFAVTANCNELGSLEAGSKCSSGETAEDAGIVHNHSSNRFAQSMLRQNTFEAFDVRQLRHPSFPFLRPGDPAYPVEISRACTGLRWMTTWPSPSAVDLMSFRRAAARSASLRSSGCCVDQERGILHDFSQPGASFT